MWCPGCPYPHYCEVLGECDVASNPGKDAPRTSYPFYGPKDRKYLQAYKGHEMNDKPFLHPDGMPVDDTPRYKRAYSIGLNMDEEMYEMELRARRVETALAAKDKELELLRAEHDAAEATITDERNAKKWDAWLEAHANARGPRK